MFARWFAKRRRRQILAQPFPPAWEESLPIGLEASEVDPQRISFVAHPDGVPAAWDRIDSLLLAATGKARKVA